MQLQFFSTAEEEETAAEEKGRKIEMTIRKNPSLVSPVRRLKLKTMPHFLYDCRRSIYIYIFHNISKITVIILPPGLTNGSSAYSISDQRDTHI